MRVSKMHGKAAHFLFRQIARRNRRLLTVIGAPLTIWLRSHLHVSELMATGSDNGRSLCGVAARLAGASRLTGNASFVTRFVKRSAIGGCGTAHSHLRL